MATPAEMMKTVLGLDANAILEEITRKGLESGLEPFEYVLAQWKALQDNGTDPTTYIEMFMMGVGEGNGGK